MKFKFTRELLDRYNYQYKYDDVNDMLVVDSDVYILERNLGDGFFMRTKFNGDLIMPKLEIVGKSFLVDGFVRGGLILPSLVGYSDNFLFGSVLCGDIDLDGLRELSSNFLSNRYINGSLYLNSLESGNGYLTNITLIGDLHLYGLIYVDEYFLIDSLIYGDVVYDENINVSPKSCLNLTSVYFGNIDDRLINFVYKYSAIIRCLKGVEIEFEIKHVESYFYNEKTKLGVDDLTFICEIFYRLNIPCSYDRGENSLKILQPINKEWFNRFKVNGRYLKDYNKNLIIGFYE